MHPKSPVTLYFDFVSPYSWLALMQAEAFGDAHRVEWIVRPVVYAALLDRWGLVGPAEVDVKRDYTFHDVARCARRAGLRFAGPPCHPFRSIEALRAVCSRQDDPRVLGLAVRLADACWGEGEPLTELPVLERVLDEAGFHEADLATRMTQPEVKLRLRRNTDEAIERGVFGVPTLVHRERLFWGHDRLSHLAEELEWPTPPDDEAARRMLRRPRGADRRRARRVDSPS